MCEEINIGNFTATKQKDGTFLYKAKEIEPLRKKVKAQYKDPVQYPVIEDIENEMKKSGKEMIVNSGIEIMKFLAKL